MTTSDLFERWCSERPENNTPLSLDGLFPWITNEGRQRIVNDMRNRTRLQIEQEQETMTSPLDFYHSEPMNIADESHIKPKLAPDLTIPNCWSLLPDSIKDCKVLAIEKSCSVGDAYRIVCERPWIKTVIVAGQEYTRPEIGNMSPEQMLGGGKSPHRITDPIPTPPITTRVAYRTDPEYDRAIEQLMRDNPNYRQFGDAPVNDLGTDVIGGQS